MRKKLTCASSVGAFTKETLKTDNFLLKVLTAMNELQSKNTTFKMGISFCNIVNYMEQQYDLDGDTHTQVHIALQQACHHGFVTVAKNKYKLIGPMAKVVGIPHSEACKRSVHIQRTQAIFWNNNNFVGHRRRRVDYDRCISTSSDSDSSRFSASRSRSAVRRTISARNCRDFRGPRV